jgi:hypothetical protein
MRLIAGADLRGRDARLLQLEKKLGSFIEENVNFSFEVLEINEVAMLFHTVQLEAELNRPRRSLSVLHSH